MTSSSHSPVLRIERLRKSFGRVEALRGVSMTLGRGERLALLGPNGAGKSTLIRCISGRTRAESGEIQLRGRPIDEPDVRNALGLVPQDIALYADLTTRENLRAFGRLQGLRGRALSDRLDWALHWTGLEDRANHLVGGFSGGMKRRVNLACGVMHAPQVLLLDEPTVGVDPQSRQRIFAMLDELSREGVSILLTTHHLDEAEERSDRIVIMDSGKVIADGTKQELVQRSVGTSRMVRIRIDQPLREPMMVFSSRTTSYLGEMGKDLVSTRIDNVSQHLPRLLDTVRKNGYEVRDVEVTSPSLHHVFLHLTGQQLRD